MVRVNMLVTREEEANFWCSHPLHFHEVFIEFCPFCTAYLFT